VRIKVVVHSPLALVPLPHVLSCSQTSIAADLQFGKIEVPSRGFGSFSLTALRVKMMIHLSLCIDQEKISNIHYT